MFKVPCDYFLICVASNKTKVTCIKNEKEKNPSMVMYMASSVLRAGL